MVLTLYKIDDSPPCRVVMMLIQILKIDNVEYVDVDLLKGEQLREEFIKLNPQHTVPTLVDDDFIIWDSHAIAGYLISEYGTDDSLYPRDPKKRAVIDQRLHFDTGILFTTLNDLLMPLFSSQHKFSREENETKLNKAYDFLERFLTKAWIAGDEFSIADLCCGASVSFLDAILPVDVNKYPKVGAWMQKCARLDYFANTYSATKDFGEFVKNKFGII